MIHKTGVSRLHLNPYSVSQGISHKPYILQPMLFVVPCQGAAMNVIPIIIFLRNLLTKGILICVVVLNIWKIVGSRHET